MQNIIDDLKQGTLDVKTMDLTGFSPKPIVTAAVQQLMNNSIVTLSLDKSDIVLSDIVFLSRALASNTSLVSLNLSGNNFAANACLVLGRALEVNTTLKELRLNDNERIDSLAIESLLIGLKQNKTLRRISLLNNLYTPQDGLKLIKSCGNITTFDLDCFSGWQRLHYRSVQYIHGIARPLALALKSNFTATSITIGDKIDQALEDYIYGIGYLNQRFFDKLRELSSSMLVRDADLSKIALSLPRLYESSLTSKEVKQYFSLDPSVIPDVLVGLTSEQLTRLNSFMLAAKMPMFIKDVYLFNSQATHSRTSFMSTMSRYYLAKSGVLALDVSGVEEKCAEYYAAWKPEELMNRDVDEAVKNVERRYQQYLEEEQRKAAELAAQREEFGETFDPDDETRWSCQRWGRQAAAQQNAENSR